MLAISRIILNEVIHYVQLKAPIIQPLSEWSSISIKDSLKNFWFWCSFVFIVNND